VGDLALWVMCHNGGVVELPQRVFFYLYRCARCVINCYSVIVMSDRCFYEIEAVDRPIGSKYIDTDVL
jgi:hypothetical protein